MRVYQISMLEDHYLFAARSWLIGQLSVRRLMAYQMRVNYCWLIPVLTTLQIRANVRLLTFVCGSLPTQLKHDVIVNGIRRPGAAVWRTGQNFPLCSFFPKRCVCQLFSVDTSKSSPNFEYNLVSLSLFRLQCLSFGYHRFWSCQTILHKRCDMESAIEWVIHTSLSVAFGWPSAAAAVVISCITP